MRYTRQTTLRLVWFLENGRLASAWRLAESDTTTSNAPRCRFAA